MSCHVTPVDHHTIEIGPKQGAASDISTRRIDVYTTLLHLLDSSRRIPTPPCRRLSSTPDVFSLFFPAMSADLHCRLPVFPVLERRGCDYIFNNCQHRPMENLKKSNNNLVSAIEKKTISRHTRYTAQSSQNPYPPTTSTPRAYPPPADYTGAY